MRTPEGPATLHLHRPGVEIVAQAWGDGAGWAIDRIPDLVGAGDDPGCFTPDHPLVAELHRRHLGWRFGRTGLVFEALLQAIVAQKVTGHEAGAALKALMRRFSEPAPGPRADLFLPPDPVRMAAAPYYMFHQLGIERRRADVIRHTAAEANRIERLAGGDPGAARRYLERFPGVGEWTSAETVAVSHGDPDAVSVGDFHLKHIVAWHLAGEERGTDEQMLDLVEPFRPHRGRVIRLLGTAGGYPRKGPRLAPRSFADS